MATNNPKSPRQKMINLMYLVFIAMLALNVSSEVLDGFDLVEEGLEQTIKSTEAQNNLIIGDLTDINSRNPVKAGEWYKQADGFTKKTDSLFNYIQDLKLRIVREADGKNADIENIKNKESLDAASYIMLSSTHKEGQNLKAALDNYRAISMNLVTNTSKKNIIKDRLNTEVPKKGKLDNKNWQETYFEQMPTSAAITLLTKIQSDVRATQGEVLSELLNNISGKDFRVNSVQAEVIPVSEFVTEGGAFEGRVVLTAVDTTQRPTFDNPAIKDNGEFRVPAGGVGSERVFSGIAKLRTPDGGFRPYPFSKKYHVVPRMVAIQPELTNVLYRGRDNKLTISVPGMSGDQITPRVSNGTITKSGQYWIAKPTSGDMMEISVYGPNNTLIEKKPFKVRPVPDPSPYINFTDASGNVKRFKGGRISKAAILNADGLKAAIDDGLLDEQFTVTQFTTTFYDSMGNGIREISNGNNFSDKQKSLIKQLTRGKSFYITDVKARVYGEERDIAILEVRIN
jgi:gliding motility-associated protein GldM